MGRHRPKLGQHFLHDQQYRTRIVAELPLQVGDVVIEIGPGRGAMTALLAEHARKVIAIEVDAALAQQLQEDFRDQPSVQIILADVLRVDFAALCRQEGIARAFVFGNLPYYITSPILHHLFAQRDSIRSMGLLMQREVAERVTAVPGTRDYGYLTACRTTLLAAGNRAWPFRQEPFPLRPESAVGAGDFSHEGEVRLVAGGSATTNFWNL